MQLITDSGVWFTAECEMWNRVYLTKKVVQTLKFYCIFFYTIANKWWFFFFFLSSFDQTRIGRAIAELLRRIGLPYQGIESHGKIKIHGLSMRRWFEPNLASSNNSPFSGKSEELMDFSQFRPGNGIAHQQRNIRSETFSLDWSDFCCHDHHRRQSYFVHYDPSRAIYKPEKDFPSIVYIHDLDEE